jgi:hypothetical protein
MMVESFLYLQCIQHKLRYTQSSLDYHQSIVNQKWLIVDNLIFFILKFLVMELNTDYCKFDYERYRHMARPFC